MAKIMVVDDETVVTMQLEERLTSMGYEVTGKADSGESAIEMARDLRPDLVVMDIVMPGDTDGVAASEIIGTELDVPVIFLTAYTEDVFVDRAKRAEPFGYVVKPVKAKELKAAIEVGLYKKDMDRRLRVSEKKFRSLFEDSKDGVFICTFDGRLLDINAAGLKLFGCSSREELAGIDMVKDLCSGDDNVTKLRQTVEHQGFVRDFECAMKRKDGQKLFVLITATAIRDKDSDISGYQGIIRDITQRKCAEDKLKEYSVRLEKMVEERTQELRGAHEQLVRQEKLAVLGQLAGGVGHELRNPLGAIKNTVYFLNMALKEPAPGVKDALEILNKEIATSERIISTLLDFSRSKPPALLKVDINDVVQAVLSHSPVPDNVKVVCQLDETLPAVQADPDQLSQVFGNLILNAIQAMPEGGRLVVKSEAPSPERVTVSFTDTGAGMDEETLGKVFEPLFTTKAKGIGLGLALTKMFIDSHGGNIEVESEVGKGTTSTVSLPIDGKK